ncbi:MAG: cytochrome b/b6 domain-containing protein [Hyphomicrobiaceae bacterium]
MTEPTTSRSDTTSAARTAGPTRVVWDLGVRAFHWLLVAGVAGALATGLLERKSLFDLHVYLGTAIGVLVLFRVVWGFSGSTYARFASFVCSPFTALGHLRDLLTGKAPHHVGHNPLGTWMILALLTTITALLATGVIVLGGVAKEGPVKAFATYAFGHAAKTVHEGLAFGLMGLIGLHVLGIVVESLRTRESLVGAMIHGRKKNRADDIGAAAATARPFIALVLAGCAIAGAYAGTEALARLPARGVPGPVLDKVYAAECGACHTPHHPSIAPAATWQAIMANLGDHFGDNADLDADAGQRIGAYLTANASERWDTRAANRLRAPSASEPLRVTHTRGWKRLHRHVPGEAFASAAVGGRANCARCHRDSDSGRFAARAIAIPQERTKP